MLTSAERFITYALGVKAIELIPEGRKLKSGRISPYFFNSGLFKKGTYLTKLAQAYASVSSEFEFKVVFGPAYKGIPLAVAVAQQAKNGDCEYAFNRKEVKDHGEGGIIVGASLKGKNVLIVDDVTTTGTSLGEAVEIVRTNGGIPVGCIIAFDRQERGINSDFSAIQEFRREYGLSVIAVATLLDLIHILRQGQDNGTNSEILGEIMEYKKQYGVSD